MERHPRKSPPSRACTSLTYVGVAIFGWVFWCSPTRAQTLDTDEEVYIPELRSPNRLMIGAGGGLGGFNGTCSACRTLGGAGLEVYAGWQLHRRFALLVDSWTTVHFLPADSNNPGVTGFPITTLAVQSWITPILFVRAGLGIGGLAVISRRLDAYDHGPGFSLVVGGELGHRRDRGIDASIRFSGGSSQYSNFGADWYFSFGVVIGYHRNIAIGR